MRPWIEQLRQDEGFYHANVKPKDMAFVFTTSGNWGFHHLVGRTHEQFITIGQTFHDLMELEPDDVVFNERSLGSLWGSSCVYVATGNPRVLVDMTVPPKDPLAFTWQCSLAERCNVAVMIPPQISNSLSRPDLWKDKKPKLRNIVTGKWRGTSLTLVEVNLTVWMCTGALSVFVLNNIAITRKHNERFRSLFNFHRPFLDSRQLFYSVSKYSATDKDSLRVNERVKRTD